MAKIYGLFGSMTGKLADTVMSVRNGEQIARKYQPVVFNPSTPAQVAQRAKLKLLSQLSAVMAPVIAMRRQGSVSARNLFTRANFPKTTYSTDTATINLTSVSITNGMVGLPPLFVNRASGNLTVSLALPSAASLDRVVYAMFCKLPDNTIFYAGSAIASAPGETNTFPATLALPAENAGVIVYGYGIRDNSVNARVAFGNITFPTAEAVANLLTSSILVDGDVTLTETRGVESTAE